MKRKYISILSLLFCLVGCDYLEFDESTAREKETIYAYFHEIDRLVAAAYAQLPSDWGAIGGALRESASDNGIYTWNNNAVYDIYQNTWSPSNVIDDAWAKNYKGVRIVNSFLENFDLEKLERFQWDANYEDNVAKAKKFPYELRALRAFYFLELAKRYGDVPLLTRTYGIDEINTIKRKPFEEVIDFIVQECDTVAKYLPVSQADFYGDTGRATKGFALSIKARALLYAASPLHNPSHDADRWREAALAAQEVIRMDQYSLPNIKNDPIYHRSGANEILKSTQLIFERREGKSFEFEMNNLPIGFERAKGGNTPTQNLVDAYEMKDGTSFDWSNETHLKSIYVDAEGRPSRDPRFYKNILYNYAELMNTPIELFYGGKHALPLLGASLSGYYLKKGVNETVSLKPGKEIKKEHHFILFRYAEILLNYAEAMNEWKGPDYTDADFDLSARDAVNLVRSAANMPAIAEGDQSSFRTRLQNERRVELAFEDHRFWDIRRWKMGDVVKDIYGVAITLEDGEIAYERAKIQSRIWDDKMYLYPIPQTEIFKNKNLTQNPGW